MVSFEREAATGAVEVPTVSDHTFERFVQTTKIVLLLLIWILGVAWYLGRPRETHAQLAAAAGFKFTPITSATNTQVSTGAATLHNIMINGGTLTGVITVVDTSAANCTGGTTIATIAANQVAGQNYVYDLQTANGLCITTAAAVNATVDWR